LPYRGLADLLLVIHFLFVVFVVAGGLLVLRRHWVAWVHLPAALWGALIEFGGWICPLTPLENRLRAMAGVEQYAGGFVEHYLLPVMYPAALTRGVQVVLGLMVVGVNATIYWRVYRSR
jgi:hypothetical protein